MDKLWIVVANASRARVCERRPDDGSLLEVADFVHPQSRQAGRELTDDNRGRVEQEHGDSGRGGTRYEPRTDPRQKEHEHFARELAGQLDAALAAGRCNALLLLASNPFLGELKSHLSAAAQRALRGTEPVDLTGAPAAELRARVDTLLRERG